jgi:hypothetical protein
MIPTRRQSQKSAPVHPTVEDWLLPAVVAIIALSSVVGVPALYLPPETTAARPGGLLPRINPLHQNQPRPPQLYRLEKRIDTNPPKTQRRIQRRQTRSSNFICRATIPWPIPWNGTLQHPIAIQVLYRVVHHHHMRPTLRRILPQPFLGCDGHPVPRKDPFHHLRRHQSRLVEITARAH